MPDPDLVEAMMRSYANVADVDRRSAVYFAPKMRKVLTAMCESPHFEAMVKRAQLEMTGSTGTDFDRRQMADVLRAALLGGTDEPAG